MRSSACTFFAFVPLILVPGHAERTEALAMEESEQLVDDALAAASLTELFVGASRNLTGCLSDSEKTFIRAEAAAAARAEAAATVRAELRAESVAAARSGVASAHGEAAPTPCGEAIATARAEAAAAARAGADATVRAEAVAAARAGVASTRGEAAAAALDEPVAMARAEAAAAARAEAAATARAEAMATAGQIGTMRFDPTFDSYTVGGEAVAAARAEAAAAARAEAAATVRAETAAAARSAVSAARGQAAATVRGEALPADGAEVFATAPKAIHERVVVRGMPDLLEDEHVVGRVVDRALENGIGGAHLGKDFSVHGEDAFRGHIGQHRANMFQKSVKQQAKRKSLVEKGKLIPSGQLRKG
eukprot:TRINITY_DN3302_c0_g1_i5.p1 TRINITY_DN3302_c0_g1~~TRINITY_DN3302_c0_g1_i5.p1  ORF type:complete len:363 (+),score=78.78 TRINITY_DN3302_c0_g1_i5:53-1141(+)